MRERKKEKTSAAAAASALSHSSMHLTCLPPLVRGVHFRPLVQGILDVFEVPEAGAVPEELAELFGTRH